MNQIIRKIIRSLSVSVLLALVAVCGTSPLHGEDVSAGIVSPKTKDLADAPVIVAGFIDSLTKVGQGVADDKPVRIYEARIELDSIIKGDFAKAELAVETVNGEFAGMEVTVKNLLQKYYISGVSALWVMPHYRVRYVFFLARDRAGNLVPLSMEAFAWKYVRLPVPPDKGEKYTPYGPYKLKEPKEYLKRLAECNVGGKGTDAPETDIDIADQWMLFLSKLYDPKTDTAFFLAKTEDSRPEIQGLAIATLCEHDPKQPGLADKALDYVKKNTGTELASRIVGNLVRVTGRKNLNNEDIKTWLASGAVEVQEEAIKLILDREEKDQSLINPLIDVMLHMKTPQELGHRRVQFRCLQALGLITEKRPPSWEDFQKTPDRYIDEFSKLRK